jgi:hypothetical protein
MPAFFRASSMLVAVALAASGCKPAPQQAAVTPATDPQAPPAAPAPASTPTWPASLNVVGDGFPGSGDACRRIGESEATVDYLDDSATLAGCLSSDDAAKLGGTVVGTVDGVTLVSVPDATAVAGDGDGQGDALVPGTKYHATAQIRCSGYQGAAPGMCDAGVVRHLDTGAYVDVTLPDGTKRTILFGKDDKFLSFATAQADGTAAMKSGSSREGDMTIATLDSERYEIPDALVIGD